MNNDKLIIFAAVATNLAAIAAIAYVVVELDGWWKLFGVLPLQAITLFGQKDEG